MEKENQNIKNEEVVFEGEYIESTGKRKTSTAKVRAYKNGKGTIIINGQKISQYLEVGHQNFVKQPLKLSGHIKDFNISIVAAGGGKKSQAVAIRHALSRILLKIDSESKPSLKSKGWLTRDARKKERKKPGLKKARRAPQWSKR